MTDDEYTYKYVDYEKLIDALCENKLEEVTSMYFSGNYDSFKEGRIFATSQVIAMVDSMSTTCDDDSPSGVKVRMSILATKGFKQPIRSFIFMVFHPRAALWLCQFALKVMMSHGIDVREHVPGYKWYD